MAFAWAIDAGFLRERHFGRSEWRLRGMLLEPGENTVRFTPCSRKVGNISPSVHFGKSKSGESEAKQKMSPSCPLSYPHSVENSECFPHGYPQYVDNLAFSEFLIHTKPVRACRIPTDPRDAEIHSRSRADAGRDIPQVLWFSSVSDIFWYWIYSIDSIVVTVGEIWRRIIRGATVRRRTAVFRARETAGMA